MPMRWNDSGFVISLAPFGEKAYIAKVITENHGLRSGLVKGEKISAIWQAGNYLQISWSGRVEGQLGRFNGEIITPYSHLMFSDAFILKSYQSISAICLRLLTEHDDCRSICAMLGYFLSVKKKTTSPETLLAHMALYIHLEKQILDVAGFGLNLSKCTATGATDDLNYISPKTGYAVCEVAGRPYHNKLLPFPKFLAYDYVTMANNFDRKEGNFPDGLVFGEIIDGFNVMHHFLEKAFCSLEKKMPSIRDSLIIHIKNKEKLKA